MTQDYSRKKLRGKSFKGQNLSGADFSFCDVRGANFSGAILRGANFSNARCGMQRRWLLSLLFCLTILSLISGLICTVGGSLLGFILVDSAIENFYVGVISLVVLSLFFLISITRGIVTAAGFVAMAVIWAILAAVLWTGIVAVAGTGISISTPALELAGLVSLIVTGTVAVIVAAIGAVIASVTAALAGAIAGIFAVGVMVALSGAIAGVIAVLAATLVSVKAGTVAAAVGISVVVLSAYVGCSAIYPNNVEKVNSEKSKQNFVGNIIIRIAAKYGTNFEKADLTNADFTQTVVKNANFNKADITRTCWYKVRQLHLAAYNGTYLNHNRLQQIVTTKDLQNQNFDGWNLQGLNLQRANLKDASFIAANLNDSNLRNADLSRAKLVEALVDKTDFRCANLTGAYIEDWHITPATRLESAKCDYIFLRIPTPENPNPQRLPANWEQTFKPGEFAEFMSPLSRMR
ncbi:MAG: pentapeptide repeat-containing protein [Mastigocoleus sp.]